MPLLRNAALFLAALALLTCAGPLERVVREDAPGYEVKKPVSTSPELGRRLIGPQPEDNPCYSGTLDGGVMSSWTSRTLVYEGSSGGGLNAEFGTMVQLGGSKQSDRKIEVKLENVQVVALDNLYLDPGGPCATDPQKRAQYSSSGGHEERVTTRALRGNVTISDTESSDATARLDLTKVAGVFSMDGGVSSTDKSQLDSTGANLYIAHYPEKVKVTKTERQCQIVVGGAGCDLDPCSFQVTGLTAPQWTGRITCQGNVEIPLSQTLEGWTGGQTAPGVSYSVRARSTDQVGKVDVDVVRWNVLSTK